MKIHDFVDFYILWMYLTGYSPEIKLSPQEINKQALQCNEKKTNSKQVQELSVDLYFSVFVKVLPLYQYTCIQLWHRKIRSVYC